MNIKPIAAHVATIAASVLAVLNIVAGIASQVKLPAADQAIITTVLALVAAIEEAAKQAGGVKGVAAKLRHH